MYWEHHQPHPLLSATRAYLKRRPEASVEELECEQLPSTKPSVGRVYVHLEYTISRENSIGEDTRVSHHLLMPATLCAT